MPGLNKSWLALFIILLSMLVSPALLASNEEQTLRQSVYWLRTSVVSSAGVVSESPQYKLTATLGQAHPVGWSTSQEYQLHAGFWQIFTELISTDAALPEVPANALYQNYPNPFNPQTTISYSVATTSPVAVLIYDLEGKRVRTLVRDIVPAGSYQVNWDGRGDNGQTVPSGMYFCRLEIGGYTSVKKMLMLK
jgi:hypothetical protein